VTNLYSLAGKTLQMGGETIGMKGIGFYVEFGIIGGIFFPEPMFC
jgi:hypothetical protein